jgi:hypothetical protein
METAAGLPLLATAVAWTNHHLKWRLTLRAQLSKAVGPQPTYHLVGEAAVIANGGSCSLPPLATTIGPNRHFRQWS